MPPQSQFEMRVVAQNGLDMQLNCLAVPSLVEGLPVAASPVPRATSAYLAADQPNPFNPRTTIRFGVPVAGRVSLVVYAQRGRRVRTLLEGPYPVGEFETSWDGRDDEGRPVVSGTYFCKLHTEKEVVSRKMSLAR